MLLCHWSFFHWTTNTQSDYSLQASSWERKATGNHQLPALSHKASGLHSKSERKVREDIAESAQKSLIHSLGKAIFLPDRGKQANSFLCLEVLIAEGCPPGNIRTPKKTPQVLSLCLLFSIAILFNFHIFWIQKNVRWRFVLWLIFLELICSESKTFKELYNLHFFIFQKPDKK